MTDRRPQRIRIRRAWWAFHALLAIALIAFALR